MRTQLIFPKTYTTRKLRKRVPLTFGSGFTTIPDGEEELYYETSVNLDLLDQMARKAAGNSSSKSSDGPLTVKILARRRKL